MEIYTSYFARLNNILEKGYYPISIARYTPKNISTPQLTIFAPSEELLRKIKTKEITEKEFETEYRNYLEKFDFNLVYQKFEEISKNNQEKSIVLLCFEKSGEFCHRNIFSSVMREKTGKIIEELKF